MTNDLQPCTEPRCGIHGRGAIATSVAHVRCPRQILHAYGRGEAVALLEQEPPLNVAPRLQRVGMSLSTLPRTAALSTIVVTANGPPPPAPPLPPAPVDSDVGMVRPGQTVRLSTTCKQRLFRMSGLYLPLGSDFVGWQINDILLAGRSQIAPYFDLPAELFSSKVGGSGICAFDQICEGDEITIVATRVGQTPACLLVAIMGQATRERFSIEIGAPDERCLQNKLRTYEYVGDRDSDLSIVGLEIERSEEWIVNDIRIAGRSQFASPGAIPGDMFAVNAIDSFVRFDPLRRGKAFAIDVTYIGVLEELPFKAKLFYQDTTVDVPPRSQDTSFPSDDQGSVLSDDQRSALLDAWHKIVDR